MMIDILCVCVRPYTTISSTQAKTCPAAVKEKHLPIENHPPIAAVLIGCRWSLLRSAKRIRNPPVAGVGRTRRYCNTGTTRGRDKASFESSPSVQTYD